MLESSRAKEDAVKQETAEQLEAFRIQRAAAEQAAVEGTDAGPVEAGGSWAAKKKKRRREKEVEPTGDTKLRRLSTADNNNPATESLESTSLVKQREPPPRGRVGNIQVTPISKATVNQKSTGLGLAAYSSDEDD